MVSHETRIKTKPTESRSTKLKFAELNSGMLKSGMLKSAVLFATTVLVLSMAAPSVNAQQTAPPVLRTAAEPAAKAGDAKPEAAAPPETPAPVASTNVDSGTLDSGGHDHMVQLPGGGPALKIRGFFDVDFGSGAAANSLVYPLPSSNSVFRAGEFDLFMSSKLSEKWSFVGELVIGTDQSNTWGIDLERYQLTYRASPHFEVSAGRYHTAIGYYNTAFHHGTWFQTAAGRPFMYFFEDSGGLLPVHSVGITTTGLVPGSGALNLHWVAEIGNGRGSDLGSAQVQNFVSDRSAKDVNFAVYIKPQWAPGLQVGGSYFIDRLYPPSSTGLQRVDEHVSSAYAVYNNGTYELLAEGVLLTNKATGGTKTADGNKTYDTPLWYAQASRKFNIYRPYFRYQFVNSPLADTVNVFTGRYQGPSVGLRVDVTAYAAFKVQYNRVDRGPLPAQNGFTAQMAFAF